MQAELIYELVQDGQDSYYKLTGIDTTITPRENVTEIVIPNQYNNLYVKEINESVFNGCSSLNKLTLPFIGSSATATSASETTLFGYIFGSDSYTGGVARKQYYSEYSSNFVTYYIPSSLKEVIITGGELLYGAFYNCKNIINITLKNVTSISQKSFSNCSSLESIEILSGIKIIDNYAFYSCSSLISIVIPNSITSIGSSAFYSCPIEEATIPTTAISSIPKVNLKKVIINGGTIINYGEFSNCSSLISIEIPNSVTNISELVFASCSSLTSVIFGENSKLTSIGNETFYNCSSLTRITIPSSVTSIGDMAFNNCSNLINVTFENPNNWEAGSTSLLSSDLSNSTTAATYLTSTYVSET